MTEMIIVAILVTVIATGGAYIISHKGEYRKQRNKVEGAQYECGIEVITVGKERINMKFYYIAIIFLIFDLEILLLIPITTIIKQAGIEGTLDTLYKTGGIVMIGVIGGIIYEYKKGII